MKAAWSFVDETLRQQKEVDAVLAGEFKMSITAVGELKSGTVAALNADPSEADRRPVQMEYMGRVVHVEKFIRDKSDDVTIMRTADALDKTMHFLVHNFLRRPHRPDLVRNDKNAMFEVWSYLSDRFRAVRTDWIKQTPTLLDRAGLRRKQWLEFTIAASAVAGAWCSRNKDDCYHYIHSQSDFYKFTCLDMIEKCFSELVIYIRMERRLRNAEMLSVLMILNGLNQTQKQESRDQFCILKKEDGGFIEPVAEGISVRVYNELKAFPAMAQTRHVRNVVRIIQCVEQRCWLEFFRLCRSLPWTVVQRAMLLNSFSFVRFRTVVDLVAVEASVSTKFVARYRGFVPIEVLTKWLMFDDKKKETENDCLSFLSVMGLIEFVGPDPEKGFREDGSPFLRLQVSRPDGTAVTTIERIAETMTEPGRKQRLFFPPCREFIGFQPYSPASRTSSGDQPGGSDISRSDCPINVMELLECYCPPYRPEDKDVHLADCPEELFADIHPMRRRFLKSSRAYRRGEAQMLDSDEDSEDAQFAEDTDDDEASLCTEEGDLADDTFRLQDELAGITQDDAADRIGEPRSCENEDGDRTDNDETMDPGFASRMALVKQTVAELEQRDVYEAIRRKQKEEREAAEAELRRKAAEECQARQKATTLPVAPQAPPPSRAPAQAAALTTTKIDFAVASPLTPLTTGAGSQALPSVPTIISPADSHQHSSKSLPFPSEPGILYSAVTVEAVTTAAVMSPSLHPVVESPVAVVPNANPSFSANPSASILSGSLVVASQRVRSSGSVHPTFVSPPKESRPPPQAQRSPKSSGRIAADVPDDEKKAASRPSSLARPSAPSPALQQALSVTSSILRSRAFVYGASGITPTPRYREPLYPLPWSDVFEAYMINFFRFTHGEKHADEVLLYLASLGVTPTLPPSHRRSVSRARRSCSVASMAGPVQAGEASSSCIRSDVERRLPLGLNVVALPDDVDGTAPLSLFMAMLLVGPGVNAARTERRHPSADYVFADDIPSLTRRLAAMLRASDVPMEHIGSGSLIRDAIATHKVPVAAPSLPSFLGGNPALARQARLAHSLRQLETVVQCHVIDYAQLNQVHFHAEKSNGDGSSVNPAVLLPLAVVCAVVVDATSEDTLEAGVAALEELVAKHWQGTMRIGGVVVIVDAINADHADDVEQDLRDAFWAMWTDYSSERQKMVDQLRSRHPSRGGRSADGSRPFSAAADEDVKSATTNHSLDALAGRPSFSFVPRRSMAPSKRMRESSSFLDSDDAVDDDARRLRMKLLVRPLGWPQPVVNICPIQRVVAAAEAEARRRRVPLNSPLPSPVPGAVFACFSSLASEFEAIWMEELPNSGQSSSAAFRSHRSTGVNELVLFVDDE